MGLNKVYSTLRGYPLPQQLPGPAHPESSGEEPQQLVSPGPGILLFSIPDEEAWAESCFCRLTLPQLVHRMSSVDLVTSISLDFPQSIHKYSYIGIVISPIPTRINRKRKRILTVE